MGIRIGLSMVALSLALAMLITSSMMMISSSNAFSLDATKAVATHLSRGDGGLPDLKQCSGRIGDCIEEDEEMMMMDESSEATRRSLRGRGRYVSYNALRRNSIPCNRRGRSYYQCSGHRRANPYSRGCGRISRCARNTR